MAVTMHRAFLSVPDALAHLRGGARVRETIRGAIVSGRLKPGTLLPSHLELARRFGVSNVTVQQALSQLAGQGFLDVRSRVGTYVHLYPPHLNHIALAFVSDPHLSPPHSGRPWTRHYAALAHASARLQQQLGRRFYSFHGVDEHAAGSDRERLLHGMERQQFAGVVFTTIPLHLRESPILTMPGFPRVAIASQVTAGLDTVLTHSFDAWCVRALDWLAQQGRRRVATLGLSSPLPGAIAAAEHTFERRLAERGMMSLPRWRQLASIRNPDTARRIAELLLNDRERPDALLITDDNFVEPALAGVAGSGVRVPADLTIVAHANFPLAPNRALPARFLGYDTAAVLTAGIGAIDALRRGESVPELIEIEPFWEEDLAE